jgi:hypothetical protein
MGVTTTTLGGLLKNVYGKRLVQQQNKAAFLYKMLPKSMETPSGTGFFPAVSVAGNMAGGAAINETEALPTAGNETVVQFKITPKINTWTMQITGLARAVSEGNESSFARGLVRQFDEGLENMIKDMNRQVYGSGNGLMATVTATATSATQTVDNVQYLKPGMVIDVYTAATATNSSLVISSVDRANNQITLSAPATLSVNDQIVRAGARTSAASDGKEMTGLKYIIDNGSVSTTFQNQSRSTYPILNGNVISAGSVNLTNDLLQRAADEVSIVGDGRIDMIISRHGQRRKYLDLVTPDKRFLDDKLDRGYQYIYWNGMKWYIDVDAPKAEIIGLTQKYIERFEVRGIHLADDNNSILKWNGSSDTYIAYYRAYANLGSLKPNANFRLTNLNEPTGSN